jgi:hypothetical protein
MYPSTQGTSFLAILRQVGLIWDDSFDMLTMYFAGSQRSFIVIKNMGEGSFGSVFLCDWHGKLPHEVLSPSAIHINGVVRPEWTGMRLVAVKKLKRRWEHGWNECQDLKELKVQLIFWHTRASC